VAKSHTGKYHSHTSYRSTRNGNHLHLIVNDFIRDNSRPKRTTTHAEAQSSSRPFSTRGDRDQQSASRRASNSPTIDEIYDWHSTDTSLAERGEVSRAESIKHQQRHDLLGLALQDSRDDLLDNELQSPKNSAESISQEQISACPVHGALLAELQDTTRHLSSQGQGMASMPMERFLAEGLAERYTLLKISQTETEGDWARYSACLCHRK
jgi:hypothetical protein